MGSKLQPQKHTHGVVLPTEYGDILKMYHRLRRQTRTRAHGEPNNFLALYKAVNAPRSLIRSGSTGCPLPSLVSAERLRMRLWGRMAPGDT